MLTAPQDADHLGDVMSNFDHGIDLEVAERLKSGGVASYPAWNFHGTVWWSENNYHCQVKQYQVHVDTVSAETLRDVMAVCCSRYGDA